MLIGCGTFDKSAREVLEAAVETRLSDSVRLRIERLTAECADPDERLGRIGRLLAPLYSHDLIEPDLKVDLCDARGHRETWADMLRLQECGRYPAAFAAIEAPVLMLHGSADPHPGRLIRDGLAQVLPQLEYCELERCGHYPWLERDSRELFFALLRRFVSGS